MAALARGKPLRKRLTDSELWFRPEILSIDLCRPLSFRKSTRAEHFGYAVSVMNPTSYIGAYTGLVADAWRVNGVVFHQTDHLSIAVKDKE